MHDTSVEVTVRYINKHGVFGRIYIIDTPEITIFWTVLEDAHADDAISQVVAMDNAAERRERRATTE